MKAHIVGTPVKKGSRLNREEMAKLQALVNEKMIELMLSDKETLPCEAEIDDEGDLTKENAI